MWGVSFMLPRGERKRRLMLYMPGGRKGRRKEGDLGFGLGRIGWGEIGRGDSERERKGKETSGGGLYFSSFHSIGVVWLGV